ncbi:MAG: DUF1345 domain-containing protein [Bacteroidota bacterium]
MTTDKAVQNIFLRMHPFHRIIISLALAVVAFLLVKTRLDGTLLNWVVGWDVFAFFYCLTCWIVFFTRNTSQIKQQATREDGSRAFVIGVIVLASFASMVMVLMLMVTSKENQSSKLVYSLSAILGMLFSWTMVHTTFGFNYAHIYYDDDLQGNKQNAEGLEFPNEKKPDYLDFAYFAFVIGMTFQVSDVEISSRQIRRLALLHGLLSFLLNTFVVALTINLIAGLQKG